MISVGSPLGKSIFLPMLHRNPAIAKCFTIIPDSPPRYQCICGSVLLRSSIRSHVLSKTHLAAVAAQENTENNEPIIVYHHCDICFEDKDIFKTCSTCKHDICIDCSKRVNKCPFCRSTFHRPLVLLPALIQ
jgi:hypothetical protein